MLDIIEFPKFNVSYLQDVISKILTFNTESKYLPGLKLDTESNIGFILPMTNEWLNFSYSVSFKNKIIKYHDSRKIEFVKDNDNIIGIRFKDNIRYWSNDEINYFIFMVKISIDLINDFNINEDINNYINENEIDDNKQMDVEELQFQFNDDLNL